MCYKTLPLKECGIEIFLVVLCFQKHHLAQPYKR